MDRKAIIAAVGITSKKVENGVELFCGKKKIGRLEGIKGAVRFHYPRGSEYKHTTAWGQELTDEYIESCMFDAAARRIMEAQREW